MIINADSLIPHLKEKVRPTQSDDSRHLLCPHCGVRTKLNTLGDGRRKCSVCGRKFRIHKVTKENKLQQCAEILMCFCLDFSPLRTSQITHHRYRLVAQFYEHFRKLIAEKTLIRPISAREGDIHMLPDTSRCRWCKKKMRSGQAKEKPPAFGVQIRASGEITIDPLNGDEAVLHLNAFGAKGLAGFICCGKFHRFTKEQSKDGAEKLWTWIQERAKSHHGIWKSNTGFYLKELEWKYNNRSLHPDLQARKVIDLMPMNFLTSWLLKKKNTAAVQISA